MHGRSNRPSFRLWHCTRRYEGTDNIKLRSMALILPDAHVIRNAGGNAKDALRSLIISQQLLGTKEIVLVKHTGCGMLTFKNEDAHAVVKKQLGESAAKEIDGLDFQPFPELEQAVKDDLEFIKSQKAILDDVGLSGWVYEVETGKVKRVV